jgi:hypothetical protein
MWKLNQCVHISESNGGDGNTVAALPGPSMEKEKQWSVCLHIVADPDPHGSALKRLRNADPDLANETITPKSEIYHGQRSLRRKIKFLRMYFPLIICIQ